MCERLTIGFCFLISDCLFVCLWGGVCESVLNMPLLVVTSIKRGENGFHFHIVLVLFFAFSLFFATFCFLEGGAWEPKIGFAPPRRHSKAFSCEIFPCFCYFLIIFVYQCFCFQFSVKNFSAAKEIFGRIFITFQCVYFCECVWV